ncbi:MAG: M23 family metallopeptidase [Erysipelotrichaceae bacterium]|nr:M23 family metallopeptidase [Erysipelotrichaceae bacterium]
MKQLLKIMLVILTVSQMIVPASLSVSASSQGWYWPLWRHDEKEAEPVTHMSRGYSSDHHALDIAPMHSDEIVEVRATKDGTIVEIYSGCQNENGYYSGPCAKAGQGCDPVRETLKGYDNKGKPNVKVTENNFVSSSNSFYYGYCNGGLGNAVSISHDDGTGSLYAHMEKIVVSIGDKVRQGDVIGYAGSTGYSTGRHLHFAVYGSQQDLLSKKNPLNCNPNSPDLKITLSDDENMRRNSKGYAYDADGIEYVFETGEQEPEIVLSENSVTLKVNETYHIMAELAGTEESVRLSYKSQNRKIAYVDRDGVILAMSPGETVITVSYKKMEATLTVIVTEPERKEEIPVKKTVLEGVLDFIKNLFH